MEEHPVATVELESGAAIEIELYPDTAPNTVRSFISLIRKGYYNGLTFHRVIPGFMIQGGCPKGVGIGGPGYSIRGEFALNGVENSLKHTKGVISMARSSHPDSAGSQFFIMAGTAPHLDGNYAAFGKVISGFDEVERIVSVPRDRNDKPLSPERMKRVTVELFDTEYPEPDKVD